MVAELSVLQYDTTALMLMSRDGNLDAVRYLVEECKADVSTTEKVKQRTESNTLLVWFAG